MNQPSSMIADAYFDSFIDAHAELQKRNSSQAIDVGMITRVVESPYSGYRVWSMPADVYVDLLTENLGGGFTGNKLFGSQKSDLGSEYVTPSS